MPKRVLLTNEQFKRLISEVCGGNGDLIMPVHSTSNIFSTFDTIPYTTLMEGIFRTYEPEKIIKYLKKRYGDAAIVQIVYGDNDEKLFMIRTGDIDLNQEIIDRDMALCGYFPSFVEKNNGQRTIQYEPRHQNKVNDAVQDEEYIYHLTQTNKVNKILNIGLTPKANNKKFVYPDRVYFFLHEPETDDCLCLMEQFYNEEMRKFRRGETDKVYGGTYTLLRVDTEKLKGTDFSYDPNAQESVYTYDNIPPDAIEVDREIEQVYIKK